MPVVWDLVSKLLSHPALSSSDFSRNLQICPGVVIWGLKMVNEIWGKHESVSGRRSGETGRWWLCRQLHWFKLAVRLECWKAERCFDSVQQLKVLLPFASGNWENIHKVKIEMEWWYQTCPQFKTACEIKIFFLPILQKKKPFKYKLWTQKL